MLIAGGEQLLEREENLAELEAIVGESVRGRGRLVVVEGPPGIGKTALLGVARDVAVARGMDALTARGSDLEREFPFGVARQLLEPTVAAASSARRRRLLTGAAALAAPALGLQGAEPRTGEPPLGDAHFPAVHGLFWLVAGLAAHGPLLMRVDDCHWADPPSLRFLAYLARRLAELPVALILAARPSQRPTP